MKVYYNEIEPSAVLWLQTAMDAKLNQGRLVRSSFYQEGRDMLGKAPIPCLAIPNSPYFSSARFFRAQACEQHPELYSLDKTHNALEHQDSICKTVLGLSLYLVFVFLFLIQHAVLLFRDIFDSTLEQLLSFASAYNHQSKSIFDWLAEWCKTRNHIPCNFLANPCVLGSFSTQTKIGNGVNKIICFCFCGVLLLRNSYTVFVS